MERLCVAVLLFESVTFAVNVAVPVCVGVPLTRPAAERLKPKLARLLVVVDHV